MKNFFFLALLILAILSCQNRENEQSTTKLKIERQENKELFTNEASKDSLEKLNTQKKYTSKYIEIENVLVNANKLILSKKEFDAIYQKNDSIKTTLWECGSPFEWLDREWMLKTYGTENKEKGTFESFNGEITTIYRKNVEYNTNNHIVIFNTASASNNSFKIISHAITLDKNTTLKEFKTLFPNSIIENYSENKNEVRARFYLGKDADDAFLFCFKNGKLETFKLWWLLC